MNGFIIPTLHYTCSSFPPHSKFPHGSARWWEMLMGEGRKRICQTREEPSLIWVLGLNHPFTWISLSTITFPELVDLPPVIINCSRKHEAWIILCICGCKNFCIFSIQMLPEFEHWTCLKWQPLYSCSIQAPDELSLIDSPFFFLWEYPNLSYKCVTSLQIKLFHKPLSIL